MSVRKSGRPGWYVGATEDPACAFEVKRTTHPLREKWIYALGPYTKREAEKLARDRARDYGMRACVVERSQRRPLTGARGRRS